MLASVGPKSAAERGRGRRRVEPQELHDERPVPDRGLTASQLPSGDRLAGDPPALGEDSLRQAEIEPSTTELFTECHRILRVTPWEHGGSGRLEPQAGKRQRNGARAAGSGIPSAAAAAARAT